MIIERILARVNTIHKEKSGVESIEGYCAATYFPDPAPAHEDYKSCFNFVDKLDKYWYKTNDSHKNCQWKSKYFLGVMRYFVVNVFSISSHSTYSKLTDFRADLVASLLGL